MTRHLLPYWSAKRQASIARFSPSATPPITFTSSSSIHLVCPSRRSPIASKALPAGLFIGLASRPSTPRSGKSAIGQNPSDIVSSTRSCNTCVRNAYGIATAFSPSRGKHVFAIRHDPDAKPARRAGLRSHDGPSLESTSAHQAPAFKPGLTRRCAPAIPPGAG
jgi:hypothetical protein